MPIYEYQCGSCDYKFEMLQKITEKPIDICPKCKGKVKRLISKRGSFILKGSGWYVTDYVNKDKQQTQKHIETKAQTEKTASNHK